MSGASLEIQDPGHMCPAMWPRASAGVFPPSGIVSWSCGYDPCGQAPISSHAFG
jgi:hypothetical protein